MVEDALNTASCGLHLFLGKHYTNVPLAAEIMKLLLTRFFKFPALQAMLITGLLVFYSCCYDQTIPTWSKSVLSRLSNSGSGLPSLNAGA